MALRLVAALVCGGLIGLERSYHGRPAGFRTHALVCVSTSVLMLITVHEARWFEAREGTRTAIDPTRMAQGIMTGIGFLGAGAIMKDGLTIRGLTTAASIWITAAIGVLVGIGFYFPAALTALLTLGTLSVFRRIEASIPARWFAHFTVRFRRDDATSEADVRRLIGEHGFSGGNFSYQLKPDDDSFEYGSVITTDRPANANALSQALRRMDNVVAFQVSPAGD
jgi:putative Mg2+ transporter-C (MgtC) family protein